LTIIERCRVGSTKTALDSPELVADAVLIC
jgi:hypothetical protein